MREFLPSLFSWHEMPKYGSIQWHLFGSIQTPPFEQLVEQIAVETFRHTKCLTESRIGLPDVGPCYYSSCSEKDEATENSFFLLNFTLLLSLPLLFLLLFFFLFLFPFYPFHFFFSFFFAFFFDVPYPSYGRPMLTSCLFLKSVSRPVSYLLSPISLSSISLCSTLVSPFWHASTSNVM